MAAIANLFQYQGKYIKNEQGHLLTTVSSDYPFNYHTTDIAIVLLPNGKYLQIQSPTAAGEAYARLSADFNLCIVAGGYHWGSYLLSQSYLSKNVYIYDLPNGYSLPIDGADGAYSASYIISKYEPVAVIKWDQGTYKIKVMTPTQAGGYY